ncbi:MAG: ATP-binding protein [Pirellulaceae bacterium]
MFSPLAHERQITIDLQGESTVCTADAERTAQVIANLLHNAILYNRPGGSVTLSTLHEAGCAVLRVGDTGAGIPPESLPHLFDRFYRVDHSRSRQAEDQRRSGSGLGLAICKSIIDAHHGSLAVTSQIGEGSQFEAATSAAAICANVVGSIRCSHRRLIVIRLRGSGGPRCANHCGKAGHKWDRCAIGRIDTEAATRVTASRLRDFLGSFHLP